MKTRLPSLLVGLLLASMLSTAQAQQRPVASVRMDSVWGCPGEIIEVPVRFFGIDSLGVNGLTFYFQIDTNIIEPVLLSWDPNRKMGSPLFTGWDEEFMREGIYATNYFWGTPQFPNPSIAITWIDRDSRRPTLKREDGSIFIKLNFRIKKTPAAPSKIELTVFDMIFDGVANRNYRLDPDAKTSGHIVAKSNPQVKIEGKNFDGDFDVRICRNQNLPLKATGAQRFEWQTHPTDPGGFHYSGPASSILDRIDVYNPLFTPIQDRQQGYKLLVRGYNSDGCFGVDSVLIFPQPTMYPLIQPQQHLFLSRGESIDLKLQFADPAAYGGAFMPYTYHWFPEEKVENSTASVTRSLPINEPTWFWGQTVDRSGCTQTINIKVDIREDTLFGFIKKSTDITDNAKEFCGENGITEHNVNLTALIEGGSGQKTYEWEFQKLYDGREPEMRTPNAKGTEFTFYGTTEISVRIWDLVTGRELILTDTIFVMHVEPLFVQIEMDEASQIQYELGFCTGMPITFEMTVKGHNPQIHWEINGYRMDPSVYKVNGNRVTFPNTGNGFRFRAVAQSTSKCVDKPYAYSNEIDPKSEFYQVTAVWIDSIGKPASNCNNDSAWLYIYAHNLGINPFFQIYKNDELIEEFTYTGTAWNFKHAVKSENYWDRFSVRFTNTSCNCLINNNRFSNYRTPNLNTTTQLKAAKIVSDMGGDTICNSTDGVYAFRLSGMEQFGKNTTVIWMLNDKEWGRYEFDETVSAGLINAPAKHRGDFIINDSLEQDEYRSFVERYAFRINDKGFPIVGQDIKAGDSLWAIVISRAECEGGTIVTYNIPAIKPQLLDIKPAVFSVIPTTGLEVCKGGELTFNTTFQNAGNAWVDWYWNERKVGSGSSYTLKNPRRGDSLVAVLNSTFKCAPNLPYRVSQIITVHDLPKLTMARNLIICENEETQLSVQTTATISTWSWREMGGSVIEPWNNIQQPTVRIAGNVIRTYIVTATDTKGCQTMDSITIQTAPKVEFTTSLQILQGDTMICKGTPVFIRANVSLPEGPTQYRWIRNGFAMTNTDPQIFNPPLRDGDILEVQVTKPSLNTCLSKTAVSKPIQFLVAPPIRATISASDNKICNQDSIMLIAGGGARYLWTTLDPKINGQTHASVFVKPEVTTTYNLRAFDKYSLCTSEASITIVVEEFVDITNTIQINNRPAPEFCANADNTFVFEATPTNGGLSPLFDWYVNGVIVVQTTSRQFTRQLNDGDEIYCEVHASADIVTCGNQFAVSQTIVIIERPIPVGGATGDTTLCPGEPTPLKAFGGTHYVWTPATGLSSNTVAEPIATPEKTTNYAVRISNEYGCFITDTVRLTVLAKPAPLTLSVAAERDSLCVGQSMTMNLTANYQGTIKWFINGEHRPEFSTTTLTYTPNPNNSDVVYASMKVDNVVCLKENEKQSNVFIPRVFNVFAELPKRRDTICRLDTLEVTVNSNATIFRWQPPFAMNIDTEPTIRLFPPRDYRYWVLARIGNCQASDTLDLVVNALPNDPVVNDVLLCTQDPVDLPVLNPQAGVRYLWYLAGNLNVPIDTANVLKNRGEGIYVVRALAQNGCRNAIPEYVNVVKGEIPHAEIRLLSNEILAREVIRFENASRHWQTAFWRFETGRETTENNATIVDHEFVKIGSDTVVLVVKSKDGCLDTFLLPIQILPQLRGIFVPSAFMPSSSNPEDQVLKVYGENIASLRFTVYSLEGRELFTTQNPAQGWDGRYQGRDMPTGNYSYTVVARLDSGEEIVKSGTATLIR